MVFITNILVASANISKILWPSFKKNNDRTINYKKRGVELRKLLDIDDNSILKFRKVRNHFEHYDERIEEWCKTGLGYVDSNITNVADDNTKRAMRNFNFTQMEVTFKDTKFEISKVSATITELHNKIIELDGESQNEILKISDIINELIRLFNMQDICPFCGEELPKRKIEFSIINLQELW